MTDSVEDPPTVPPVTDPDPVTDPAPQTEDPPKSDPPEADHRPGFVDEIINHITSKVDEIKSSVPPALDPVVDPDPSPVRPPWTHRKLFGKRD